MNDQTEQTKLKETCRYCGKATYLGGTLCDPCWEVQWRVRKMDIRTLKMLLEDVTGKTWVWCE